MSDSTVAVLLGGAALAISGYTCAKMIKHDIKKWAGLALIGKCAYKIGNDMNLCKKFGLYCNDNDECECTEEEEKSDASVKTE